MLLTLVFQNFEVNLEGESIQKLQHYDIYNLKNKKIKFKKIEGQWFKIDKEEKERDVSEPMPQRSAPATSSSTVRFVEDQIKEIVQHVSDRVFDHISGCLSSLMENTVRKIFVKQHAFVSMNPASSAPFKPTIDQVAYRIHVVAF